MIALGRTCSPQFVISITYEAALFEQRMAREPDTSRGSATTSTRCLRSLPQHRGAVDALMGDVDPETRFEFGLAVIVAGLVATAG